jgi:hypothetical protein
VANELHFQKGILSNILIRFLCETKPGTSSSQVKLLVVSGEVFLGAVPDCQFCASSFELWNRSSQQNIPKLIVPRIATAAAIVRVSKEEVLEVGCSPTRSVSSGYCRSSLSSLTRPNLDDVLKML